LAGFQVIMYGRFWVFTEDQTTKELESSILGGPRWTLAPHKTRYLTTCPKRKLLNLKGERMAMEKGGSPRSNSRS
jgi:hypothetical protein